MTARTSARDFYLIDEDDNDAICGEIDSPNLETVLAWMEVFSDRRVNEELQAHRAHIQALEEALRFVANCKHPSGCGVCSVRARAALSPAPATTEKP